MPGRFIANILALIGVFGLAFPVGVIGSELDRAYTKNFLRLLERSENKKRTILAETGMPEEYQLPSSKPSSSRKLINEVDDDNDCDKNRDINGTSNDKNNDDAKLRTANIMTAKSGGEMDKISKKVTSKFSAITRKIIMTKVPFTKQHQLDKIDEMKGGVLLKTENTTINTPSVIAIDKGNIILPIKSNKKLSSSSSSDDDDGDDDENADDSNDSSDNVSDSESSSMDSGEGCNKKLLKQINKLMMKCKLDLTTTEELEAATIKRLKLLKHTTNKKLIQLNKMKQTILQPKLS